MSSHDKALGNMIKDSDGKRPKREALDPDEGKREKLRSGCVKHGKKDCPFCK